MAMEAAGAVGLFLLTFVSEDSATVAAAGLASLGQLGWIVAFGACVAGIWIGDLGLFLIARQWGRPALERLGLRRAFAGAARSEAWFARHGWWALVVSRFVPGARLPTFVTAGLLRMNPVFFGLVTAALAVAWVALVFLIVRQFGAAAVAHPATVLGGALALVGLVGAFLLGRRIGGRWREWEFWPAWLFYLPVAVHYGRLAWRHGGLTVPASANPGMFTGGLIGESKFDTLRDLAASSPEFTAVTFLLPPGADRIARLDALIADGSLGYPLVLKPDVGQRGSGFRVARTPAAAAAYLAQVPVAVLAQEYVPGPLEAGVFYYRHPGETRGRILAITEKVFPAVVGDGARTVAALIAADPRACRIAETYLARLGSRAGHVPAPGERVRLVEAGNHAQGCLFRDGMAWWSEALEARFDAISRGVPGFFVGRYDVRFADVEAFRAGHGFRILELNGAASEATSAYDARRPLRAAYALLFRQWDLVFAIGAANRHAGHPPLPIGTLWRELRRYRRDSACHPLAD